MTLEQMEEALKAFTDRLDIIDTILRKASLGVEMVPVFMCGHSGLYFPVDYVKEWGRLYGVGLGPHPVSEVLDSEYHVAPPAITEKIRRVEQICHPVRISGAQVDLHLVEKNAAVERMAILAIDDPFMDDRMSVVLPKQLGNSETLALLHADFRRKAA